MLPFASDYMQGMHPTLLEALARANLDTMTGYGSDVYTESAKEKIRAFVGAPDADVYFLAGGTQTNMVAISALLHPTEGVVAATTGHIAVHESGAIEATGHKVLTVPSHEGKVDAAELEGFLRAYYADETHEHAVFPGMLYLSHPTEYGTLYTREELMTLARISLHYDMRLFVDGARLGYGLSAQGADVTAEDLAMLCDAFYIGGTKVGAICGEALVFPQGAPKHFFTFVKQNGALLAKGFLCGIQFDTLFTDNLYLQISEKAVSFARDLRNKAIALGYETYMDSPTNQQFFVLNDRQLAFLSDKVHMSVWEPLADGRTVVRFATSWATTEAHMQALYELLQTAALM